VQKMTAPPRIGPPLCPDCGEDLTDITFGYDEPLWMCTNAQETGSGDSCPNHTIYEFMNGVLVEHKESQ
jgi:hypothetical protein